MVYRKDNYYEKLSRLTTNNFDVITDFDRTITTSDSTATWGVFNHRGILPSEYDVERNSLYSYYRPIELDDNIDESVKMNAMDDWQSKHLDLFIKYGLNEEYMDELFALDNVMTLRDGFKEFYNYLEKKKIPLKVLSAGISDFIKKFLESKGFNLDNIIINSNDFKYDREGNVIGFKNNIIHSLNKIEFSFPKEDKDNLILIGDQVSDIMMDQGYDRDNVIAIAFVPSENINEIESFNDVFDMVLTENESYQVILDDLIKICEKFLKMSLI